LSTLNYSSSLVVHPKECFHKTNSNVEGSSRLASADISTNRISGFVNLPRRAQKDNSAINLKRLWIQCAQETVSAPILRPMQRAIEIIGEHRPRLTRQHCIYALPLTFQPWWTSPLFRRFLPSTQLSAPFMIQGIPSLVDWIPDSRY